MTHLFRAIVIAAMLSLASGVCGCESTRPREASPSVDQPATAPPAPLRGTIHTGQSDDGQYRLKYATDPDPLPLNEPFQIDVLIERMAAAGLSWDRVSLSVDARMPEHHHGMNVEPRVEALGNGRFRVTRMLFHMPGYWELYFDIDVNGVTTRVQFEITLD